jgi:hypothetical protein
MFRTSFLKQALTRELNPEYLTNMTFKLFCMTRCFQAAIGDTYARGKTYDSLTKHNKLKEQVAVYETLIECTEDLQLRT